MIWLARNNELWESACPALIFLPWHLLRGCQSDGRIKRSTTFFFLPFSFPPGVFSFLAVRRAPTDQWGWTESWTTCWQDLLSIPQWYIVQGKDGEAEAPVHSDSSQIYWACALVKNPSVSFSAFKMIWCSRIHFHPLLCRLCSRWGFFVCDMSGFQVTLLTARLDFYFLCIKGSWSYNGIFFFMWKFLLFGVYTPGLKRLLQTFPNNTIHNSIIQLLNGGEYYVFWFF